MGEGKVAVVTGGTRRIGLAIARRLAREGYSLALIYLQDEAAAVEALAELLPIAPHVAALKIDISSPDGAEQAIHESQRTLGSVDLLVNNVGPFVPSPFMETSAADYQHMVAGNLNSVFYLCQATIPLMRAQGGGSIITLGSLNAELARGAPNAAVYHALKAAVVVLMRSIARSEGPHGIRANVVNPGMVDILGVGESIVNQIPLRRLGEADEIANAVVWLASAEASYVNGSVLNVHGGLWA